ncbi:MAG: DNA polymerase IV [Gammaproteobacteria bacterium]|nr:DNA polymerase IV [Gammaproteobacteria bacterium]
MQRTWRRIIAHADMDAFYAAVEQLDDPSLRGRPILVGPNSERGVVLTASYEARRFGVRSAMPAGKARRLCPQAICVPPRFDRYQEVSETIMAVFDDFSPDVEALSIDEAFLEMSGSEHIFGGPASMGRKLKDAIREATGGLIASVGLSGTKYVAKVASGYGKPDGLTVVPPDEAVDWLAPLPISRLWGAGPKTQVRLIDLGFSTIGDVASAEPGFLDERLGSVGSHFYALSHAQDPRRVAKRRTAKSVGSDRTLNKDVFRRADICAHIRRSADRIGRRLRRKCYVAHGVRVKLKTSDFKILTRQRMLSEPTDVADTLYAAGASLLDEFHHPGPFRLVGMAAYDLVRLNEQKQMDLFADGARSRRLESAIDGLAERFGPDVIRRARDLTQSTTLGTLAPNLDFIDSGLG